MRQSIPWILWAVWKNRNNTVISGKKADLKAIVCNAQENAKIWLEINLTGFEGRRVNGSISLSVEKKWTRP